MRSFSKLESKVGRGAKKMEEISGDTTKNSMASLGILCEKDIEEQRLQIDSFIASPFQRSMESVLDRAKATAQSQGLGRITVIQS